MARVWYLLLSFSYHKIHRYKENLWKDEITILKVNALYVSILSQSLGYFKKGVQHMENSESPCTFCSQRGETKRFM